MLSYIIVFLRNATLAQVFNLHEEVSMAEINGPLTTFKQQVLEQ